MYVNAKMIPLETIPETGAGVEEIKNSGGSEFKYDIFDTF
jgi:hypothetical protein